MILFMFFIDRYCVKQYQDQENGAKSNRLRAGDRNLLSIIIDAVCRMVQYGHDNSGYDNENTGDQRYQVVFLENGVIFFLVMHEV
jgi:hypothetical protein